MLAYSNIQIRKRNKFLNLFLFVTIDLNSLFSYNALNMLFLIDSGQ